MTIENDHEIRDMLQKAELQQSMKNPTLAVVLFDEVLTVMPADHERRPRTLAHRAQALCDDDRVQDGLADFQAALALKPDYPWALAHYGDALFQTGDYVDALEMLDKAVALHKGYAWAYAHRAKVKRYMMKQGFSGLDDPDQEFENILFDFDESIRLNPSYGWAYAYRSCIRKIYSQHLANRAEQLEKAGDWPESAHLLRKGLDLAQEAWEDLRLYMKPGRGNPLANY